MGMKEKPFIGLSLSNQLLADGPFKSSRYRMWAGEENVRSISDNGAVPILLPMVEEQAVVRLLVQRLDGIILSGGADLDCSGQPCNPWSPAGRRTRFENVLLKTALEFRIPVLGICRGHQQINTFLGGTLIPHIPDYHPRALRHHQTLPGNIVSHPVDLDPESWLSSALGTTRLLTNSYHHQAVEKLGEGLRVVGRAPDGVVEAVEWQGDSFLVGVQFHPERQQDSEPFIRLFTEFFRVCQK